jgi:hypothetical protein
LKLSTNSVSPATSALLALDIVRQAPPVVFVRPELASLPSDRMK